MDCGSEHSYVYTKCNKHYFFGNNSNHECIEINNNGKNLKTPNLLNDKSINLIKYDNIKRIYTESQRQVLFETLSLLVLSLNMSM